MRPGHQARDAFNAAKATFEKYGLEIGHYAGHQIGAQPLGDLAPQRDPGPALDVVTHHCENTRHKSFTVAYFTGPFVDGIVAGQWCKRLDDFMPDSQPRPPDPLGDPMPDPPSARRRWMGVLAKADRATLEAAWSDLPERPGNPIRSPHEKKKPVPRGHRPFGDTTAYLK